MTVPTAPRSLLFCPADDEPKLRKLAGRGIRCVALDLEDAVAVDRRPQARTLAVAHTRTIAESCRVYIRINAVGSDDFERDLAATVEAGAAGVIVPKVESGADVIRSVEALELLGGERMPAIIAMIETATGLLNLREITTTMPDRVETLILGTADLIADLGLDLSPDERELDFARSAVVAAARAAEMAAPIDGPVLDLESTTFEESCHRSRRQGFGGRVCLTPGQAALAESVYGHVSAEEVRFARSVVDAYHDALDRGLAVTTVNGIFVDTPVYLRALNVLSTDPREPTVKEAHV